MTHIFHSTPDERLDMGLWTHSVSAFLPPFTHWEGSFGSRLSPFWSSSIDIPSGDFTKAI